MKSYSPVGWLGVGARKLLQLGIINVRSRNFLADSLKVALSLLQLGKVIQFDYSPGSFKWIFQAPEVNSCFGFP